MSFKLPLQQQDLEPNPFKEFDIWFKEAQIYCSDASAMALATTGLNGAPSCRMVLLKIYDETGFIFFTNYQSRKSKELNARPYGALNFFWKEQGRQVGIEGKVQKVDEETSDRYFSSRPRGSQIGAWASEQDKPIASREVLEEQFRRIEKKFESVLVPRPPFWGGFKLVPHRFEFWQEGLNRLHDRFCYLKETYGWRIERLSP